MPGHFIFEGLNKPFPANGGNRLGRHFDHILSRIKKIVFKSLVTYYIIFWLKSQCYYYNYFIHFPAILCENIVKQQKFPHFIQSPEGNKPPFPRENRFIFFRSSDYSFIQFYE